MSQVANTKKGELFPSLWSDFFENDRFFGSHWPAFKHAMPAVNIKEDDNAFHLELAVPGFRKSDFTMEVDENVLTITAEKEDEKAKENQRFTRKEFTYKSFSRSFTLPKNVNEGNIAATYKDGILELNIPKKELASESSRKAIKIT